MNLENQCNELYNNILELEYFYNKLVDLEDKSKRKNLRIDGIADGLNESWQQYEEQLQNIFLKKLGLENWTCTPSKKQTKQRQEDQTNSNRL